jgi:hypothetical protein
MAFLYRYRQAANKESELVPGQQINHPCYTGGIVKGGDVGLELEIEGLNLPSGGNVADIVASNRAYWRAIADGSLRNGGVEYVLSRPIPIKEVRKMVDGLFSRFAQLPDCRIKNTNRCSTHVHVNASDLKVNQVTSAIALWCTFQTCLIKWNGIERVSNHYCLSTRDEESMLQAWLNYLRNGYIPTIRNNQNLKYTALNILPLFSQGSLEFRAGGPPNSPDKVVWWTKICNAIVRYAAERFQNPLALGYSLSELGPENLLREVLEFANLGPITTERIFQELTRDGMLNIDAMHDFRDIQILIYSFPWDALMEKINSKPIPNPFNNNNSKKKSRHGEVQVDLEQLARMAHQE